MRASPLSPSSTVSSSWWLWYSLSSFGTSLAFSGHPATIVSASDFSSLIGHLHGAWTTGLGSFQRVRWYVPGKHPIPSNLSGYALMRSSLVFSF